MSINIELAVEEIYAKCGGLINIQINFFFFILREVFLAQYEQSNANEYAGRRLGTKYE